MAHVDEDTAASNRALIYVGYADLMLNFQLVELTLGEIKALQFNAGIQEDQAFAKVVAWDNMTYGQMVDSVLGPKGEWPAEVVQGIAARTGDRLG